MVGRWYFLRAWIGDDWFGPSFRSTVHPTLDFGRISQMLNICRREPLLVLRYSGTVLHCANRMSKRACLSSAVDRSKFLPSCLREENFLVFSQLLSVVNTALRFSAGCDIGYTFDMGVAGI